MDNDLPEVQGVGEGEFLTDTVTVTSITPGWDRAEHRDHDWGTNDVPVIIGELSGSVIEDEVLTASGQLSIADPDAGESFFNEATVPGAHGSPTITPDGAWTYEVDSGLPEVQGLGEGEF